MHAEHQCGGQREIAQNIAQIAMDLENALARLSQLTNWELASRARMRPTPASCQDLCELLGNPQR